MKRRLSAILAADMVGYSRMMEADEVRTLQRQNEIRQNIFDPALEKFSGRIVKEMGDGVLVEFASVVDAVKCAVIIQRKIISSQTDANDDERIQYRIGINLGDIIIEKDDIFGDGVNVAARLEQMAEPDGICISGTTYDHMRSNIDVGYESLGEIKVKNIERSIRAYRVLISPNQVGKTVVEKPGSSTSGNRIGLFSIIVAIAIFAALGWWWFGISKTGNTVTRGQGGEISKTATNDDSNSVLDNSGKPSIAVLPFDNLSNDPQQEFFSDGITEDLITDLSQVSGLFVIARNTVFTFKGKSHDLQQIGKQLGVKYILEGSVRKSGDNIRINAQLIDVASGGHVWAQRFDRKLSDVFVLQDEVVQKIVAALAITLKPAEKRRLERNKTVHPKAYVALLQGLQLMRRFTKESNSDARVLFEKAISLDPKFARAYADLAFTHALDADIQWTDDASNSNRMALENARLSLALDKSIPQTYFVLTSIYRNIKRLDDSISAAKRAIALDPNYADGYGNLAISLNYDGQYEKALNAINHAIRLNPEMPFSYLWIKGHSLYLLGKHKEAIILLEKARNSNPEFLPVHKLLVATYADLGQIEDAEWAAGELLTLVPKFTLSEENAILNYRDENVKQHYIDSLAKAGLK